MKKIIVYTLCLILSASSSFAGILKFEANTKYRIVSAYSTNGSVALGVNHGINSPLCVEQYVSQAIAEDCYWYFDYNGDGKYAICNASTKQYVSLDDQYTNSPQILRYIHLSETIEKDASLWYIKTTKDLNNNDVIYFQSASN